MMPQWILRSLPYLFYPAFWKLNRALEHPAQAQAQIKSKILGSLAKTAYGRSLNQGKKLAWECLPIATYEDLYPWIEQQRVSPQKSILTSEKILFWQQTSGSSGPCKCIPYTPSLIRSFSDAFAIWACDLLRHQFTLQTGRIYVCFSPQIGSEKVGIDDTAYLSPWLRSLSQPFLVSTGQTFPDLESFRRDLAIALLKAADLEIMSLWSPSFLSLQLDYMQAHQQELIRHLDQALSSERQAFLRETVIPWEQLWPKLKLISCWDRQFSADSAQSLRRYFPTVLIQGKGLLATEAPMTIPFTPAGGFIPLLNQVFFEFIAPNGEIYSLEQLQPEIDYQVVISPLGGFVRYQIGDRLKVSHYYQKTPCLEFVGRGEQVSDLVGEKLSLAFVTDCLQELGYLQGGFCCLAPVLTSPPHYCLFLERSSSPPEAIAIEVENALQQAFHYQQARQLGQLATLRVVIHPKVSQWLKGDRRLGDYKHSILRIQPLTQEIPL